MKLNDFKMPYGGEINAHPEHQARDRRRSHHKPIRSSGHTICWRRLSALPLVLIATSALVLASGQHDAHNETLNRDVTDLKLVPDFRAVRLRWSYKHNTEANRPIAFAISFCELTSWNVEIKCRHKDMKVTPKEQQQLQTINVIQPIERVYQLDPPQGFHYEAQIYDLRALTNYTFHVSVAQFLGSPELTASALSTATSSPLQRLNELANSIQNRKTRGQSKVSTARRLDWDNRATNELMMERVETKPFRAEATKCLADISEVVIQTGRYFGGRISVENSLDPRCNLLGNKSSEQTSYLFRIDHEICHSKIVDGTRIETMVLVHENKDILTHNTARFLVLCNFLQKSFTLRASISLPKVNGLLPGGAASSRPAVITSLGRKPTQQELSVPVMLGSMPGIYRANDHSKSAGQAASVASTTSLPLPTTSTTTTTARANSLHFQPSETRQQTSVSASGGVAGSNGVANYIGGNAGELETNLIETLFGSPGEPASKNDSLASATSSPSPTERKVSGDGRARALTLATRGAEDSRATSMTSARNGATPAPNSSNRLVAPSPVDVRSSVLFVTRGDPIGGRPAMAEVISATADSIMTPVVQQQQQQPQQRIAKLPSTSEDNKRNAKQLAEESTGSIELGAADSQAPIVMTNNHRVAAGNYLHSMSSLTSGEVGSASRLADAANQQPETGGFSIRYATTRVDDIPIESRQSSGGRMRNGRMRSIGSGGDNNNNNVQQRQLQTPQQTNPVNRMGEMETRQMQTSKQVDDLSVSADSSNETAMVRELPPVDIAATTTQPALGAATNESSSPSSTLAQNITSYLLKWSLKTLTNLAKKSLESMARDNSSGDHHSQMENVHADDEGSQKQQLPPQPQRQQPIISPQNQMASQVDSQLRLRLMRNETLQQQQASARSNLLNRPAKTMDSLAVVAPAPVTQSLAANTHQAASENSRQQVATTAPATTTEGNKLAAPAHEKSTTLDGFVTSNTSNRRRVGDQPAGSVAGPAQQAARQANYSRTMDFNKDIQSSRPRSMETTTQSPTPSESTPRRKLDWANGTSYQVNGGGRSTSNLLSWFMYGTTFALCFGGIILLAIWLAFMSPRCSSHSRLTRNGLDGFNQQPSPTILQGYTPNASGGCINPLMVQPKGQMVQDEEDDNSETSNLPVDGSYQKYEHYGRGYAASAAAATMKPNIGHLPMGYPSPSATSRHSTNTTTTMARSIASSSSGGSENDCRDSEFVCTEHILINPNGSFPAESFA